MIDREKVLKGLECCVYSDDEGVCPDECPYYTDCWDGDRDSLDFLLKKDALELLKQPEIVRCRDCRNGAYVAQVGTLPYVTCGGVDHELDWFCGDGKRR